MIKLLSGCKINIDKFIHCIVVFHHKIYKWALSGVQKIPKCNQQFNFCQEGGIRPHKQNYKSICCSKKTQRLQLHHWWWAWLDLVGVTEVTAAVIAWLICRTLVGLSTWFPYFWLGFLLYFWMRLPFAFLDFPQVRLLCPRCLWFLHLLVPLPYINLSWSCHSLLLCFSGLPFFLNSKGGSKLGKLISTHMHESGIGWIIPSYNFLYFSTRNQWAQ